MKHRIMVYLVTALCLAQSGCASIKYHRGLSPSTQPTSDSKTISVWGGRTGDIPFGKSSSGVLNMHDVTNNVQLVFSSNTSRESTLLFGPAFIIPLTIIPWPPGIWSSIRRGSANDIVETNIVLIISITAFQRGSTLTPPSFQLFTDDHQALPYTDQTSIKKIPTLKDSDGTPRTTNYFPSIDSRLTITTDPFSLTNIYLQLDNLNLNGSPITIPEIKYSKAQGAILWYLIIND